MMIRSRRERGSGIVYRQSFTDGLAPDSTVMFPISPTLLNIL
jgi:hypothetical protein